MPFTKSLPQANTLNISGNFPQGNRSSQTGPAGYSVPSSKSLGSQTFRWVTQKPQSTMYMTDHTMRQRTDVLTMSGMNTEGAGSQIPSTSGTIPAKIEGTQGQISSGVIRQRASQPVMKIDHSKNSIQNIGYRQNFQNTTDPNGINQDESFDINGISQMQVREDFQDQTFMRQDISPDITNVRRQPSILMKATMGAVETLTKDETEEATQTVEEAVPAKRKEKANTQKRIINIMKKANQREKRESLELPSLGGSTKFWDYKIFPRAYKKWEKMNQKDKIVAGIIGLTHVMALGAPFCYTPWAAALCFWGYVATAMGITTSYHRQLTHKSFKTEKWLEHALAIPAVLAVQGHPIEWCSNHRHHHVHCDKEVDPHSPYDGFYWSHMGWLFDSKTQMLLFDTSNVADLKKDEFYQFLKKNYLNITIAQPVLLFLLGGFPAMCWGYALRTVITWHVTWSVNSLSHIWGNQEFKTGDLSMNNPFVALIAFGEGWHNNHHAFEDSCRHGLKWWQFDMTWYLILALEKAGYATDLRYPKQERMDKIRWSNQPAEATAQ